MLDAVLALAVRFRLIVTRILARIGFGEDAFLVPVAAVVGVVTALAAVGFHELIQIIRHQLYSDPGEAFLYGPGLLLLIVWPALGGLVVGLLGRFVFRTAEGHGVTDVMESVVRSRGFVRPLIALEKILLSGVTIGSGGSTGAEGPIVQIGAAISSGVGQFFRLARQQMPLVIGCGVAAGISAIFNAPIGGVLFALEIILRDFSVRTFAPVVIASVIANVTTRALFGTLGLEYLAIFAMPDVYASPRDPFSTTIGWTELPNFAVLGVAAGVVGVSLTLLMRQGNRLFAKLPVHRAITPAIGGALLGVLGVVYVLLFGRLLLGAPKPIAFEQYEPPAFFSDGYGFIQALLTPGIYDQYELLYLLPLLIFLLLAKLVGTCLTLCSGGSGGVIAPALFLGSVTGGLLGILFRTTGLFSSISPEVYALVGMGAALAAVVHAPLASILILVELTADYSLVLPAMLASVIAVGAARLLHRDSVYTEALRQKGILVGAASDALLLQRLSVEAVELDPVAVVSHKDPVQKVVDLSASTGIANFVVLDDRGLYAGMVTAEDIKAVLLDREALPLLLVHEITRPEIPQIATTDDLASVLDRFGRHDVSHLPVHVTGAPGKIVGTISRTALIRRYQRAVAEA